MAYWWQKEDEEEKKWKAAVKTDSSLEGEKGAGTSGAATPTGDALDLTNMSNLTAMPEGKRERDVIAGIANKTPVHTSEHEIPAQGMMLPDKDGQTETTENMSGVDIQHDPKSEKTQDELMSGQEPANVTEEPRKSRETDIGIVSDSLKLHMQGRDEEIPEAHRDYLNELFSDPYVRCLFGEMDEENYGELITRNSPSGYLSGLSMSRLGTTMSTLYGEIMSDDFPEEIRYDSLMIAAEILYGASRRMKEEDFVIEEGQHPIEAYLDEIGRDGIEWIYVNRNLLIQDKLDYQEEQKTIAAQTLADARTAVTSGIYTPEQLELVRQNADVSWNDVINDETRAVMTAQMNKGYFTSPYSGFSQTEIYRNLSANGVTDTGSYQSAMMREMQTVIDEDTETALSVNKTLEEFYAGMGGMTLDQLAKRAHLRLQKQGESVTLEDGAAAEAYGSGVGGWETTASGSERGWNEFRLGLTDGIYKGLTSATIDETAEYLKGYYQAMGPYGRSFYRDDLNELIDSGALSEEMAEELREAMDKAPDIYAVGIDPRRFGGMLTDMKERREKIQELDSTMRENGTEGEYRWYMRISNVTTNLAQGVTQAAATAVTGNATAGFSVGYGPGYYSGQVDKWLEKGYSLKSAGALASIDTVGMIVANKAQWGKTYGQITGAGALERAAILDAGMKNPSGLIKLAGAVRAFVGTTAKNVLTEAGTGEFKENLAEKTTEEVFGPIYRQKDEGKDVTAADVMLAPLRGLDPKNAAEAGEETAENFKEAAIVSSILALAGAAGEATREYKSIQKASEIARGKSDDVAGLIEAAKEDSQNPEFSKALNYTAKQAMIDEATVEILARDKDADGTMAKAKTLETEAKEHRTQQEESEAVWDAACDEQEAIIADVAAGNYEGAAQRMEDCMEEISQYSEAAAEHERLATEKETEAGELRKTKMNEARRLAVMEVARETEKARAEMMGKENGQEIRSEGALDVHNALETGMEILGDVRGNPLKIINETKKGSDIDTKEYNDYIEKNAGLDQTGYVSEEWANAGFPNEKSQKRHEKHLVEYGDISFDEYVQGARELLSAEISDDIDEFRNNNDYVTLKPNY